MNDKGLDSVKDLTRLGRDLNRTIVIDTDPMLCDTPENVIVVSEFVDNLHDEELSRVAKFVEDINRYNIPDVRPYIKLFNENPSGDFVFSDERQRLDHAREQLAQVVKGSTPTGGGWMDKLTSLLSSSSKSKSTASR